MAQALDETPSDKRRRDIDRLVTRLADMTFTDLIAGSSGAGKSRSDSELDRILSSPSSDGSGASAEERQIARDLVVRELISRVVELRREGVDPLEFSDLLNRDQDRLMKARFGVAFFVAAVVFTTASYAIIVLAAIQEWKLPSGALTALIVQAPLQFVGILLVIARNLFPGRGEQKPRRKLPDKKDKSPRAPSKSAPAEAPDSPPE